MLKYYALIILIVLSACGEELTLHTPTYQTVPAGAQRDALVLQLLMDLPGNTEIEQDYFRNPGHYQLQHAQPDLGLGAWDVYILKGPAACQPNIGCFFSISWNSILQMKGQTEALLFTNIATNGIRNLITLNQYPALHIWEYSQFEIDEYVDYPLPPEYQALLNQEQSE